MSETLDRLKGFGREGGVGGDLLTPRGLILGIFNIFLFFRFGSSFALFFFFFLESNIVFNVASFIFRILFITKSIYRVSSLIKLDTVHGVQSEGILSDINELNRSDTVIK